MSDTDPNVTVRLANQAASLSSSLYNIQDKCQHKATADEISTIADELAKLSTTLWRLNDAINSDPTQYTEAFDEDLKEINAELTAIFEEITECCDGLQTADAYVSTVAYFFKKGRVTCLLKHLEALKGTLILMRLVLWHGKEYGKHVSDRIAESDPHIMREDRMILESVLTRNRDAIADLHNLTNMISNDSQPSTIVRSNSKAGDHHRQLSASTGVDIPPIPDVLPPSIADRDHELHSRLPNKVKRTFSKRGVKLGVHMSILDLGSHEASNKLKRKWIQHAHLRHQLNRNQLDDKSTWPIIPELSRISEVDTAAGSKVNLNCNAQDVPVDDKSLQESDSQENGLEETPIKPNIVPECIPVDGQTLTSPRLRSSTLNSIRRILSQASLNKSHSPTKSRSRTNSIPPNSKRFSSPVKSIKEDSQRSEAGTGKGKELDDTNDYNKPCRKSFGTGKQRSFLDMLKRKFDKNSRDTP